MASTHKRMIQSRDDHRLYLERIANDAFDCAGLSSDGGGYPVNGTESEEYAAGFNRGCRWAWESFCRGEKPRERWDFRDTTAAGSGEHDGWNAAVCAFQKLT
jgi:hypothetical protein